MFEAVVAQLSRGMMGTLFQSSDVRLVALLPLFAVLTGCGGGGSSTASTAVSAPSPVATPAPTPAPAVTVVASPVAVLPSCGGVSSVSDPATGGAQTVRRAAGLVEAMMRSATQGNEVSPFKSRAGHTSPQPQRIALGMVDASKRLLADSATSDTATAGVPKRIGFARDLPQTASAMSTAARLEWHTTASGGQIAAISFSSSGATGVRLGLVVSKLPVDAILRVYAQKSVTAFEVSGRDIWVAVNRNIATDGNTEAARTYWTPAVDGEESTLEIELPAGTTSDAVVLSIPRLSHIFASPVADAKSETAKIGQSASCEVDVSCTSGYTRESNATARMTFVATDGFSYLCTGTLLNDRNSTGTPYFLSANHCISAQSEASSLTTYWFYRSASCNSGTLSASTKTLAGGATLLYASSSTDTAFMRLNSLPPTGAMYAAWDPAAPALATAVVGIHNPGGDLQKISYGSIKVFNACTAINPLTEGYSCSPSTQASGKFVSTQWSRGVTEAGSSGSGLFKTLGSSNYFVGQLYGGSSSCSNPTGTDSYGRFDVAYTAALSKWLEPTTCTP